MDEALEHSEARRAFGRAPHASIAAASTVSRLNEKLQGDLLFLEDIAACHRRLPEVFAFDAGARDEPSGSEGYTGGPLGWDFRATEMHSDG